MEFKYSAFQEATIEAACKHYQNHTRVLVADEAGLGKTIVARGIIERLADERLAKCAETDINSGCAKLNAWWNAFCESNGPLDSRDQRDKNKFWALEKFLNGVLTEDEVKRSGLYNKQDNRNYQNAFKDLKNFKWNITDQNTYTTFVKTLRLILIPETGGKRQTSWELKIPKNGDCAWLPVEPYRVLYVCSNLDIAAQNTKRLVPYIQNCNRSATDRPDRLSVLWYYIQNYPTPYLEIVPITSTITTNDTDGTENECRILECKKPIPLEKKRKGENKTKEVYKPDLIIFDEFQNFADIINVANGMGEFDYSDIQRISDFCSNYLKNNKDTKLLLLSATPFHTVTFDNSLQKEKMTRLALKDIIEFLGGDYNTYCMSAEKENYLYEKCGIFRNERIKLLRKDNAAYHMLCCESAGLLPFATYLQGKGQGNCAVRAIKTTPDLDLIPQKYEGFYTKIGNPPDSMSHPRFGRLCEVVSALDANDIDEQYGIGLLRSSDALNKLLWIPPIHPKKKLGGVFAKYKDFSKTLVFSNLTATPTSVCQLLNEKVTYENANLNEGELICRLKEEFQFEGGTAESIANYLNNYGGEIFKTIEDAIIYCKDGCLREVIDEFYLLVDDGEKLLKKIICSKPEKKNDQKSEDSLAGTRLFAAEMNEGTTNLRDNFNSPFLPFVLMTTSIGAEGLDFHLYCNRIAHYTKPNGVVAMEQKNGRIDRRDSLAQRRFWAFPGNDFRLKRYARQLEESSGGAIPNWDAGEGNLHYYYFYNEFTSEKDELEELFIEQKTYRESIGANKVIDPEQMNLSPFLRQRVCP